MTTLEVSLMVALFFTLIFAARIIYVMWEEVKRLRSSNSGYIKCIEKRSEIESELRHRLYAHKSYKKSIEDILRKTFSNKRIVDLGEE